MDAQRARAAVLARPLLFLLLTPTLGAAQTPAVMTSPAPGYVFKSTSQTFTWSTGTGVSYYWLEIVGSSGVVFSQYQGSGTTARVDGLPADGATIVARVYSRIGDAWQSTEVVYTAASKRAAYIRSQFPGTRAMETMSFDWEWTDVGVTDYWFELYAAGSLVYSRYNGTTPGITLTNVPTTAGPVRALLFSRIDDQWHMADGYYDGGPQVVAQITSPAPGERLGAGSARFEWSAGRGVIYTWLTIGTTRGGYDILSQHQGEAAVSARSTTVALPDTDGSIWARIYSRLSVQGPWIASEDVEFQGGSRQGVAQIVSPLPAVKLFRRQIFTWTPGNGGGQYQLYAGTQPGWSDLFRSAILTDTQATVTGLPVDGQTIWVRLFSQNGGGWQYVDYRYQAGPYVLARLVSGPYGNLDDGAAQTKVTWTPGDGVEDYWLDVSRCRGGYELHSRRYTGVLVSDMLSLPQDRQPIWYRLWSKIDGEWTFVDRDLRAAYPPNCQGCFFIPQYPVCQ